MFTLGDRVIVTQVNFAEGKKYLGKHDTCTILVTHLLRKDATWVQVDGMQDEVWLYEEELTHENPMAAYLQSFGGIE